MFFLFSEHSLKACTSVKKNSAMITSKQLQSVNFLNKIIYKLQMKGKRNSPIISYLDSKSKFPWIPTMHSYTHLSANLEMDNMSRAQKGTEKLWKMDTWLAYFPIPVWSNNTILKNKEKKILYEWTTSMNLKIWGFRVLGREHK